MENEQEKKLAASEDIEVLQALMESLKPTSSEVDSDGFIKDLETDQLCNLLNSILRSPAFPHKLNIFPSNLEEFAERPIDKLSSLTLITEADLLGIEKLESYVVVTQKDIDEGIVYYIASYLSTLKEIKKMTPEQLRKALDKTFTVTQEKGKLHKLWAGSKIIYNLASWGATAVATYENPAVTRAASAALSVPWRMMSKLIPK